MTNLHISIAAEPIVQLGWLTLTNSLLTSWVIVALICLLIVRLAKIVKNIPSVGQLLFELPVAGLYGLTQSIAGSRADTFFPYVVVFFFYILFSNWSGLIPGVGSIIVREESGDHEAVTVPLFRAPSADLNMTLALALVSVSLIQYYGLKTLGIGYLKKFFSFRNPTKMFIGILELISEFSKIISFSFRLFGNIFAGEVLLVVIAFLLPFLAPVPFYGLEIFVGLVQALVFTMLSLVFLNIATIRLEH